MKIEDLKNMDADMFERVGFRFLVILCLSMEAGIFG